MRRSPARALVLMAAGLTPFASLAWAQSPPAAEPQAATNAASPFDVLMGQASYWHLHGRDDLASSAARRALLLDPRSADALALSAQLDADRGEKSAAEAQLSRLRASHPDDPRLAAIGQSLRAGLIDAEALAQARELARQGHAAEAVDRYKALLHGAPVPDTLAVEYNQVLSGTEGGAEAARSGLARYVSHNPDDTRGQLAYAQLLTYRLATRKDGIGRLAILANNPATAEAARAAWRQALGWIPVDDSSIPSYQAYLDRHPDDADLAKRMADARNPPRTPTDAAGLARRQGFDALQANRLTDAEAAFQSALAVNPQDSDALGGLGLTRQRQGRIADARDLLERAIAAAPAKATQWQSALDGAAAATELASARALMKSGQFGAAAEQLRSVIGRGGDVTGAQVLLADAQARSGDLAGAEDTYRTVIASQPRNATALVGLAGVLDRRGKRAEAEALLARAGPQGGGESAGTSQARQLRQQAQLATDPETAIGLLRAASAAAPLDPWVRLDLARALARQGNAAEARAIMASLTDGPRPAPDALHAAALFALEDKRPGDRRWRNASRAAVGAPT